VSLEAINTWAQLIAAVAVIGSLFYLGLQIRQNTRSMRAFAAAGADWHGASEDDRTRALPPLNFSRTHGSNNVKAHSILNNGKAGTRTSACTITSPGVKTWWPMRRAAFAAGFRDYIETSQPIKDLPPIDQLIRGER
jgi:hypothetical protein